MNYKGGFRIIKDETASNESLALDIFQLLNRAENQTQAINQILRILKDHYDVSATAIRLEDNGDYPYYFFDGFSDAHLEMESRLCESENHPACICGRVLMGNINPVLPFFTGYGSFWTNDMDSLLETSVDDLGETRNVCNAEGYRSVALVPLKGTIGIIGLLQLNDKAPNKFTQNTIEFLERIGESIGIALARIEEEDQRKHLEKERQRLLHQYLLRIKELDCLYKISKMQENPDLTTEEVLDLIVNLIPGATQYPEIAVARISIEDNNYDSMGYVDAPYKYSALIQNYGVVVGKLTIGYLEHRPEAFNGPFIEEETKLVNLVAETISRMMERSSSGEWRRSIDKYALVLNDEEIRHITKLVLEDMAIGEMDREEYNIGDVPENSTQSIESYMALQFNLDLNRALIIKLQNLLKMEEIIK